MTKLGERLILSAKQARAIARGEVRPARIVHGAIPVGFARTGHMNDHAHAVAHETDDSRKDDEFTEVEARAHGVREPRRPV